MTAQESYELRRCELLADRLRKNHSNILDALLMMGARIQSEFKARRITIRMHRAYEGTPQIEEVITRVIDAMPFFAGWMVVYRYNV